MGDIEDEDKGISLGSEYAEVAEVPPKDVVNASTTQVAPTDISEMDKEVEKARLELKQKHEAAAALVVTPADLVTARHK